MKPFLLLSIRAEPAAAADEEASFRRFLGVAADQQHRVQLGIDELNVDLDDWSGVILGGGSFTYSDESATKSVAQRRAEADLEVLLDEIVRRDTPFLGACYGIGTLGSHQGGLVDKQYPEPVGPLDVTVTPAGLQDPLFADVPPHFVAFGGHKEALSRLPGHATLLATSPDCPVQAFRIGANVYATQFHPELDIVGLHTRIEAYAHHGYFDPEQAQALREAGSAARVVHPMTLLRNFARRYHR